MNARLKAIYSTALAAHVAMRCGRKRALSHGGRAALAAVVGALFLGAPALAQAPAVKHFSLESVLGYPFPLHLVSGADGRMVAWVVDQRGVRNVYVASAPEYVARAVTQYTADDGQEITNLSISRDGAYAVYVRGGDHDANWPVPSAPDPAMSPVAPQMQVWAVPLQHPGSAVALGNGDTPAISPDSHRVAFIVGNSSVWSAPIDESGKSERLFYDEGQDSDLQWSPDGAALAFVSTRTDHSFVGVYRDQTTPLRFLAPSTSQDVEPQWSPDGTHIAYLRAPGIGGPPVSELAFAKTPWSIYVADARSGDAHRIWTSANTYRASFPDDFDPSLRWTAANELTFLSSADNWPHLYALSPNGGAARLLTPGAFMVQDTAVSRDGRTMFYTANTGSRKGDFDRRHLFAVDVATGRSREITHGTDSEWTPVTTGDALAFIQAGSKQPPLVSVVPQSGGTVRALDRSLVPSQFPQAQLIVPKSVTFRAADGHITHGQLFETPGGAARKPGIVYVHGGPPRQMLTTWHYIDYYTNGYAMNQYLANHGFVVLSVNYRLGIGFGYDYAHPAKWGPTGASEYNDVLGGNAFLRSLASVDGKRIGIWGGSYGGYLTALALARNSNLFCTGVDWHGVHDWSIGGILPNPPLRYQMGDIKAERRIAWLSSPDASISTWRSPVLLVQGDDDHNVHFHQTVDLARRLQLAGVPYSELVIPNEIHDFLRYATLWQADNATVRFLTDHLTAATCK